MGQLATTRGIMGRALFWGCGDPGVNSHWTCPNTHSNTHRVQLSYPSTHKPTPTTYLKSQLSHLNSHAPILHLNSENLTLIHQYSQPNSLCPDCNTLSYPNFPTPTLTSQFSHPNSHSSTFTSQLSHQYFEPNSYTPVLIPQLSHLLLSPPQCSLIIITSYHTPWYLYSNRMF